MKTNHQLFVDKLNANGLTLSDAEKLDISYLNADETRKLGDGFKNIKSLCIPYCLPDGSALCENGETEPFFRVQYLYSDKEIEGSRGSKKPLALFDQTKKTTNHLYFPLLTTGFIWKDVLGNTKTPLIITDGELKASKACKEGFTAVGIGGAESFRDVRNGRSMLSEFDSWNIVKRDVYICYDFGFENVKGSLSALNEIACNLEKRGAFVKALRLPPSAADNSLSAFLDHHGNGCIPAFLSAVNEAVPYSIVHDLFKLNDKYCYINNPSSVAQSGTSYLLPQEKFKNNLANEYVPKQTILKNGDKKYDEVAIAPEWLKWPLRNTADCLCYEPGEDRYLEEGCDGQTIRKYNTWLGWGCEPKPGDVSLFLEYFNALTSNLTDDQRYWLLSWLAYPLQHPGTKMPSAVCLYSTKQGTGKSQLGYIMSAIYGKNFKEITQDHLKSQFTEWAIDKNFILADDVTGSKQREFADKLKVFISQREISINRKNISMYSLPDKMNYLFTTNSADGLALEDTDRRFFICEVKNKLLVSDFLQRVHREYVSGEGKAYLFDYLLKHDLNSFNPFSPPPVTSAKSAMTFYGLSDLGCFIRDLRDNPEQFDNKVVPIMTSNEILKLYKSLDDTSASGRNIITAGGVAKELGKAGIPKLHDGKKFKIKGEVLRFFIIKDVEQWESATNEEVRDRLLPYQRPTYHNVPFRG